MILMNLIGFILCTLLSVSLYQNCCRTSSLSVLVLDKVFHPRVSMEKSDSITYIKRHTMTRNQAKAWAIPHSVTACSD